MGARIDDSTRASAVSRYLAGESSSAVGLSLGVSGLSVLNWVRAAGATVRVARPVLVSTWEFLCAEIERLTGEGWPEACVEWPHHRNNDGYGTVWRPTDKRYVRVHRVVLGIDDPDVFVLHSCDNPPCFNRRHLRPGDAAQNAADMKARGRACKAERGWKVSLDARAGYVQRVLAGEPMRAVAAEAGVSWQAVSYWTRKAAS